MWSLKIESTRFIGYWVLRLQTKTLLLYTKDNDLFLITQYLQKCKKKLPLPFSLNIFTFTQKSCDKKRFLVFTFFYEKLG